jgi:hypothetical protein
VYQLWQNEYDLSTKNDGYLVDDEGDETCVFVGNCGKIVFTCQIFCGIIAAKFTIQKLTVQENLKNGKNIIENCFS